MSSTTTTQHQDPAICPPWCSGEHLTDNPDDSAGAFHHDAVSEALRPELQRGLDEDEYLCAGLEQYVFPDGGTHQPMVRVVMNYEQRSLTVAEAREFALSLLRFADAAERRATVRPAQEGPVTGETFAPDLLVLSAPELIAWTRKAADELEQRVDAGQSA